MSVTGNSSTESPSKDSLSTGNSNSSGVGADGSLSRDMSQLSLFSTGSSTSQDECFRCPGHAELSLQCMRSYLQAGQLCDVVLIAGTNGRRVPAHRYVHIMYQLILHLVDPHLLLGRSEFIYVLCRSFVL